KENSKKVFCIHFAFSFVPSRLCGLLHCLPRVLPREIKSRFATLEIPMSDDLKSQHELLPLPCINDEKLDDWIKLFARMHVPTKPVCPHHQSPFDYLHHAYFEPASDVVVWAPRGGGKTRLAALATLLDLLHKPGCTVRIMGGTTD